MAASRRQAEEEFLMNEGRHMTAAARVTQFLARCSIAQPVSQWDQNWSAGQWGPQALLLHIRRLTGERVSACSPHNWEKMT